MNEKCLSGDRQKRNAEKKCRKIKTEFKKTSIDRNGNVTYSGYERLQRYFKKGCQWKPINCGMLIF